jgi:hypothetical protein
MVVVVPHALAVAQDPDIELDGRGDPLGQVVGLELGGIDQEIVVGDLGRGDDVVMQAAADERDALLGGFLDGQEPDGMRFPKRPIAGPA